MDSFFQTGTIRQLLQSGVDNAVFPGCALSVGCGGQRVFMTEGRCDGLHGHKVTPRTLYDLASLTKPLATSLAVLRAREYNLIHLDKSVAHYLGACPNGQSFTIGDLMCHTSGLPAHRKYFEHLRDLPISSRKKKLKALICAEDTDNAPGDKVVYSDIGYMLLQCVLEKVTGSRLDSFVYQHVFLPLGIDQVVFSDFSTDEWDNSDIAPTEAVVARGGRICGEVHDDNAWVIGGVAGHAGLFGSLEGVAQCVSRLCHEYKHPTVFLPESMALFFEEKMPFRRTGAGLDMPDKTGSSSGRYFSQKSVGHLGFTGTSFWIDPVNQVDVVFLTNRVWYGSGNSRIKDFRPVLHDTVMAILREQGFILRL